jgi:hypothetical protein
LAAAKNFRIDTLAPVLLRMESTTASGRYAAGDTLALAAVFSEPLQIGGSLTVKLTTGASVVFTTTANSAVMTANYLIGAGENTRALDLTSLAISVNGPRDLAGNGLEAVSPPWV